MDLRARIMAFMKQAMKEKDAERLSTVRLISAAIKDRDIAARADGNDDAQEPAIFHYIVGHIAANGLSAPKRGFGVPSG